ncbi:hypothetical protein CIG75_02815 [Tumebacillus algifaecis]|uniref:Uncharacterized protein n=1 Tax=Tumebacillus algifaecis TaxID=1214604 RepID=A0A223CXJ6_9BACL|nr:type I polyketide synthase [Tumebacillus algifaecis]ASS74016.1 hypothetical protein CIG75_02815 [Tumebacillus algifaecis]
MKIKTSYSGLEIAVIGMAGRFPGAENVAKFWENLVGENESITFFEDEELIAAGLDPELLAKPNFVKAKGVFPDLERFDAEFFNYTPRDAAILDPQVRALHEEVYHALEDAGYTAENQQNSIGLFLGATGNLTWELETLQAEMEKGGHRFSTTQLNDKDFAATRIAYSLNLHGPSITMHSACSTSLYAIDFACRQLLTGACSIAVAGGSGFTIPSHNGYLFEEGMINSPDGHCRPFDQDAKGTVEGNGVGAVVLKLLDDAIQDRDHIYAVIRGTAANNDGNRKVGYTAPSVEGQAEVIKRALFMADVPAETISYVETHGTGTNLGDPIEVAGLKKAFQGVETGACGIGSLKASIGHLDVAAGVSSFIKTALALENRVLPASINFSKPNPELDLENSPFYVVDATKQWERKAADPANDTYHPLRAGVSAFGIGGTNIHVILEEAPERAASDAGRDWNLFSLSAHTDTALQKMKEEYLSFLQRGGGAVHPADLAWSQKTRQRNLAKRFTLAYQGIEDLVRALEMDAAEGDQSKGQYTTATTAKPNVYFLFPGLGSQYPAMAKDLYEAEPVFREELEACLKVVEAAGNHDLRRVLLNPVAGDEELLREVDLAQLSLFVIEYCMAKLLISWGVQPSGLIGHSLGEYAAACVAGVFTLPEAISVVTARGSLMKSMPRGGTMLSVNASAEAVEPLLSADLSMAAVNSSSHCTVSGPVESILALESKLAANMLSFRKIHATHAFHSPVMEGAREAFTKAVADVALKEPQIRYLSNVTGTWITSQEALNPSYYADHMSGCVKFRQGMEAILSDERAVLVEVGPGRALSTFARQTEGHQPLGIVNMIRHPQQDGPDDMVLAESVGKLWGLGVKIDWKAYYQGQERNRIPLPLYPFEGRKFPIGGGVQFADLRQETTQQIAAGQEAFDSYKGYEEQAGQTGGGITAGQVLWESTLLPALHNVEQSRTCLVLTDTMSEAEQLMKELPKWRSLISRHGSQYRYDGTLGSVTRNTNAIDLRLLIQDLRNQALLPNTILLVQSTVEQTATALRALVHALATEWKDNQPEVVVLSPVTPLSSHSGLVTLVRGLSSAHPKLSLRLLDAGLPLQVEGAAKSYATHLKRELASDIRRPIVSYVNGLRLVPKYRPIEVETEKAGQDQNRHLVVVSQQEKLPQALALTESLSKQLGAQVRVLPYQLAQASFDARTVARFVEELRVAQEEYLTRHSIADHADAHRLVDEYSARLTYDFLNTVLPFAPEATFTRQELATGLGVINSLERYVDYFLHILLEDELVLSSAEGSYTVTDRVLSLRAPQAIRSDIERLTPLFTGQLDLLEHCFAHMGPALRGDLPALGVLYPTEAGQEDLLIRSYKDSVQEQEDEFIKEIYAMLLTKIVGQKKKIRILEAGGGYGAILRKVAPLLKGIEVEYYFTDIGNTYIQSFQQFALQEQLDFLHFGLFDVTKRPEEQGLDPASFDFVFAYNAVHATESIAGSLRNLQRLLKPGAILCMLERTRVRRYVDLIWGLADGWWHFDRTERELSPLIAVDAWERQFAALGLKQVTAYPAQADLRERLDVGIIFGQMPADVQIAPYSAGQQVLPLVSTADGASIEAKLGNALRNVPALDGIIVWDQIGAGERGFDSIVPRVPQEVQVAARVNRVAVQFGSEANIPVISVSAFPRASQFNAMLTEWAVAHAKLDAATSSYRLYLPVDGVVKTEGVPQVIKAMMESGIKQLAINPGNHPFLSLKQLKSNNADEQQTSEFQNMELVVRKIWSDLFGRDEIDLDADFFEIGGDSFKMIQMTSHLEREGYKVLMNEVYNYPTIRSLARYLHDDSQLNNRLETAADVEARLHELTGLRCRLVTDAGAEAQNLLFVEQGTGNVELDTVRKHLRSLGLPSELLPHHLFVRDLEQPLPELADLLSTSEKTVLEQLQGRLSAERNAFEQEIIGQPITKRYGLSNTQRMHFRGETRLQLYLIEFYEMVDIDMLEQAFSDLVGSHGLLRSCLEKRLIGYRWREYAPPQKTPLPKVDLSALTAEAQGRVMDWLTNEEWSADFKVSGKPMYHVKLIKQNEQRYDLFFQFDHSIFDISSGQIIRHQLLQRYKDLKRGVKRAMDISTGYEEYLEQIHRGPVGIDADGLAEKFDLARYGKYLGIVKERIDERKHQRIEKVLCEIDLTAFDFTDDDENGPYEIALQMYILVISKLLNIDAVPFVLLSQKRRYGGKNFSDVVGLVLDGLPMLVPVDREHPSRMTGLIRERMDLVGKHNINFMNLVRNLPSLLKWGKLYKKTKEGYGIMHTSLLLNYAGNAETEYGKIWEYSLSQLDGEDQAKLDYGDFYGLVKGQKDKLEFLILCKFESDVERVRQVFNEEIAHLIVAHAKKETEGVAHGTD